MSEVEAEVNVKAATSAEDPEQGIASKSAAEKLKDADRKTFLFAGYIFWAMLFVSGGSTAAVIISRKKSAPTFPETKLSEMPTGPPTVAVAPSLVPSPGPSEEISPGPSSIDPVINPPCSHNDILENWIIALFGTEDCFQPTPTRVDCYMTMAFASIRASVVYSWTDLYDLGWEVVVPESLEGYLVEDDVVTYSVDLQFSEYDYCNFDDADRFFKEVDQRKNSIKYAVVMQGF